MSGAFVPVNIGSDGAFQVVARVGSASTAASLPPRERQHVLVSSEPYLLINPEEHTGHHRTEVHTFER
ncbi:hypothetical protein SK571_25065 [Lentzea sp. BCCO 10_0798]|uniref:Uncharacterized protein n=1 Tax=Lentzea kristufekii TaxID=3095430 RepID=A0ABU4TWI4_9PSEU|nr:hypothetical protein [Lentzea sp. BCCO 10_0798]MDX8052669.1 hypothetical protein [Lentzea sp. BCCO 10_0798]